MVWILYSELGDQISKKMMLFSEFEIGQEVFGFERYILSL